MDGRTQRSQCTLLCSVHHCKQIQRHCLVALIRSKKQCVLLHICALHTVVHTNCCTTHQTVNFEHVGQCSVLPSASLYDVRLLTMHFCSLCMHTATIQPLLICHSNLSRAWHMVGMPAYSRLCNHTVGFVGIWQAGQGIHLASQTYSIIANISDTQTMSTQ